MTLVPALLAVDSCDYYTTAPDGLLVEEFVLGPDHAAVGLRSAAWTAADRQWWDASAYSRGVRVDATLLGQVRAITRRGAQELYQRLGGGDLPDEATLRMYCAGVQPLGSAPLFLSTGPARIYRVLFANELSPESRAQLRVAWDMTMPDDPRVLGSTRMALGDDVFAWDLRRIGLGAAWCLDVTVTLAGIRDDAIRPVLRELTGVLRGHGLIPVTLERFA